MHIMCTMLSVIVDVCPPLEKSVTNMWNAVTNMCNAVTNVCVCVCNAVTNVC